MAGGSIFGLEIFRKDFEEFLARARSDHHLGLRGLGNFAIDVPTLRRRLSLLTRAWSADTSLPVGELAVNVGDKSRRGFVGLRFMILWACAL